MARPLVSTKRCSVGCWTPGGFTLVESMIASVVLAIAIVGIAGTLAASSAQTSALETNSVAVSLARQLMEEISSRPLVTSDSTPGWPTQTNRASYDSINDYSGYSDTAPVTMLAGDSSGVASGYTRSVTLTYPTSLFGTTVTSGDWVLISVSVRDPQGRSVSLNKLVARTTVTR